MFLLVDGMSDRTEKEKDADAHEDEALIMYLHWGLSRHKAGMLLSTMVLWLPSFKKQETISPGCNLPNMPIKF